MMAGLSSLAQSGGLDGALLTSNQFFQTDYTKPLLFMADGGLLEKRAEAQHLLGEQWGMMNETGSYPGQTWLWLYTFWYQVEPIKSSPNADLQVMLIMLCSAWRSSASHSCRASTASPAGSPSTG